MKKILDFGTITGHLLIITYWHMFNCWINSMTGSFTMVFITNFMITNIGPEIQAGRGLIETSSSVLIMLWIGRVTIQKQMAKTVYFWIILFSICHSGLLFFLVTDPAMVCIGYGLMAGVMIIMMRLMSFNTNMIFRGSAKAAHESVCSISATIGAVIGSSVAILFKDMDIWNAIYIEIVTSMFIWLPSKIYGTKLILDEIEKQGGIDKLSGLPD